MLSVHIFRIFRVGLRNLSINIPILIIVGGFLLLAIVFFLIFRTKLRKKKVIDEYSVPEKKNSQNNVQSKIRNNRDYGETEMKNSDIPINSDNSVYFCPRCHGKITEKDIKFCTFCGKLLNEKDI